MPFPQRLIDGYGAFRADRLPQEQSRFLQLAEQGQSPEIMVIGCCDSRVSPEVIFDARPGELFVARNIANLEVSGSISAVLGTRPLRAGLGKLRHGVDRIERSSITLRNYSKVAVPANLSLSRAYVSHRHGSCVGGL